MSDWFQLGIRCARRTLALAAFGLASTAQAAVVTQNDLSVAETAMDAVFSQASFFPGAKIDIRFGPLQTLTGPTSVDFDGTSTTGFQTIADLAPEGLPRSVNLFFMDQMLFDGMPGIFDGFALLGRDMFVLSASVVAEPSGYGALLLAHELGHLLGLQHTERYFSGNVMDYGLGPEFTRDQVFQMFSSPLVQRVRPDYFVTINPYVLVSAVPEPGSLVLVVLALAGVTASARRLKPRS